MTSALRVEEGACQILARLLPQEGGKLRESGNLKIDPKNLADLICTRSEKYDLLWRGAYCMDKKCHMAVDSVVKCHVMHTKAPKGLRKKIRGILDVSQSEECFKRRICLI